jgi:hypothetical protein
VAGRGGKEHTTQPCLVHLYLVHALICGPVVNRLIPFRDKPFRPLLPSASSFVCVLRNSAPKLERRSRWPSIINRYYSFALNLSSLRRRMADMRRRRDALYYRRFAILPVNYYHHHHHHHHHQYSQLLFTLAFFKSASRHFNNPASLFAFVPVSLDLP